ncbi:hypothetical protein [Spongiactinospora sp. TRM90649]|uniref:hypothetical protein n=1 Tax=Spongiactinospora sp. TRM90649 TaxID=3031114 RepID=UPI0023FA02CC|nr:hypothetical protein [Spongiactinospora sp. TRM90649]MDF5755817.1 hypothetical protein [Spongiactinospora sp. TRM90649]
MSTDDPMIAALLRERDGLVRRGLDDRVAQVDEQLAARGHTPPGNDSQTAPEPSESGSEASAATKEANARSTPPRGRRASRKDTT